MHYIAVLFSLTLFSAASAQECSDHPTIEPGEVELKHPPVGDVSVPVLQCGDCARVSLTKSMQVALVPEGVELQIDCGPWASQFEGGSVQWQRQLADLNGNPGKFHLPLI